MVSELTRSVAERARHLYEVRLRATLEAEHTGRYVAVEPESGDFFVADTFDAAADAAQSAHPARQSHVLRVGHAAALHIGGAWS
jgi:hypothetical protein